MDITPAKYARDNFSAMIREVEHGNPTTVTRNDRPVVVVIPAVWPRWHAVCASCLRGAPQMKKDCGGTKCEVCGGFAQMWVPEL